MSDLLNEVLCADSIEIMGAAMQESVIDLAVFSPPYAVNMEYEDEMGEEEYREFMVDTFGTLRRALKTDGRFCCVVPFRAGAKSGRWSRVHAVMDAIRGSGMSIRDLVVWYQRDINGTAWGSFASASAPNIQYRCEFIVIGYNEQWAKQRDGESTITNDEFVELTQDNIWDISTGSDSDHPATYPEELCERLIKLLSYRDGTVLDPFAGVGNTLTAAKKCRRDYIGIEKEEEYAAEAKRRVDGISSVQEDLDSFIE